MSFSTFHKMLAAAVIGLAGLVAGCGGGGGAGGQGAGGGDTGTGAPSIKLLASTPSVGSDGKTIVTLTAYVRDSGNRALSRQLVVFSSNDNGVLLQPASVPALTDASGAVSASLQILDPENRDVTVLAETGGASSRVGIAVIGTTVALNGPGTLVANVPAEFSVAVRDSAGGLVAGKTVSVASAAGNLLSATTLITDSAGRASFSVTGVKPGLDTVSVSGLGVAASLDTVVSDSQLLFVSPAAGKEVPVSTAQQIQVALAVNGVPQAGAVVEFLTTRGSITTTATTNAGGVALALLQSSSAGPVTVSARVGELVSSRRFDFVSTTPAKLNLQASPANVGVNLSAATSNSSQLIAVVRDATDNPVKGQIVSFSADSDPSAGRIEPALAVTDVAGVASSTFFPGPNTTGNNQIVMRAAVLGSAVTGTTTLTASKQELFVRIGTGNTLAATDTSYTMPWDAVVTDSSGNPVPNAVVQASLVSVAYLTGQYHPGEDYWYAGGVGPADPPGSCRSEDSNGNLRLDSGEDVNGDGLLTPGNVAAVQVVSDAGRTDASGFARIEVKYPKGFANWARVRLTVTIATIAGTEGRDSRVFDLVAVREDLSIAQNPPGGVVSAFGLAGVCDPYP